MGGENAYSMRHHCPMAGGDMGTCDKVSIPGEPGEKRGATWCAAHQIRYLVHRITHLKTEVCNPCHNPIVSAERRAKKEKEKELKEAEKAKQDAWFKDKKKGRKPKSGKFNVKNKDHPNAPGNV